MDGGDQRCFSAGRVGLACCWLAAVAGRLWRDVPLALITLAFVSLAFASRADAFIYWANSREATAARSGGPTWTARAPTRASSPAAPPPTGVAVDGCHIYWANRRGRTRSGGPTWTARAPTRASSPAPPAPIGVAVDGSHVYWANLGRAQDLIGRANLDGTGANQSFITRRRLPRRGVAVDGSHVYWTNRDGAARSGGPTWTARASTRASSPAPPTRPGWRSTAPTSTGPTSQHGTIGRANLDGTGVNQSFITGASGPVGVAVNGTLHLLGEQSGRTGLWRHDRAGQPRRHRTPTANFIAELNASFPDGLAVNALLGGAKPHVCSGSFSSPGVLKGAYPNGVVVKGVCFVNAGKAHVTGTLTVSNGSALVALFGAHHSSLTVTRQCRFGSW